MNVTRRPAMFTDGTPVVFAIPARTEKQDYEDGYRSAQAMIANDEFTVDRLMQVLDEADNIQRRAYAEGLATKRAYYLGRMDGLCERLDTVGM